MKIRPGICLNFYDFTPGHPTQEFSRNGVQATFEMDFILHGKWFLQIDRSGKQQGGMVNESGNSGVYFFCPDIDAKPHGQVLAGDNLKGILLSVDADVMTDMADSFFTSPPGFTLSTPPGNALVAPVSPIIPAIHMVIQQILVPPVGGRMSSLYLEGKIIELIALRLSQCLNCQGSQKEHSLSPQDIQIIQRARQILVADILNPPSIPELAKKVGINEQKLKFGFRKVHGDTVYRTLRAARMEEARKRFDRAEDSVLQVATQVGYANPGHFAAAFRECFGMTPSVYLSSRRREMIN